MNIDKDVLGNYVENIDEPKNTIGEENKEKSKPEQFNKWMAYPLIADL